MSTSGRTVYFTCQPKINTHNTCILYTNRAHQKGGTKTQIHELVILKTTDQNAVDHRFSQSEDKRKYKIPTLG